MSRQQACNEEHLVLYHYKELSAAESRELDAHLHDCADCRAAMNELQSALAAVPQVELELSPAEKRNFAAQVSERARRSPAHLRAAWGGVLATAALVAGIMLLRPADLPLSVGPTEPAMAEFEILQQLDLLQEMDLLKELDLLQEMEQLG